MDELDLDSTEVTQRLAELVPGRSLALIREARTNLADEELAKLSSDQRKIWASIQVDYRRLEWSEARRCEATLRSSLGSDARTSISHTRVNERAVVFAAGAVGVRGLGIDVELRSRTLTEAAALRFIRPEEASLPLDPLQIWVIKEALFKSNPENADTVLPQYRITSCDRGGGIGQIGAIEFRFRLLEFSGWVVSVAVC